MRSDDFDHPDRDLADELNRRYGDTGEEPQDRDYTGERRKLVIRVFAVLIFIVFTFTVFARHLHIFNLPSLDFLKESYELIKDPGIRELRKAVVEVRVARREGTDILDSEYRGTGFNIRDNGLIVTNRHVIENARSIIVTFPDDGSYAAVEWYLSDTADLAVIVLDGSELPAVETEAHEIPMPGDEVLVIGNPLGYTRVVVRGEVKSYRDGKGLSVLQISAPIHPGSSGSPVFNREGRVVGVVYAVASGSEDDDIIGLAVPIGELEALPGVTRRR